MLHLVVHFWATYTVKDGYLVDASGLPVAITKDDLLKIGMNMEDYLSLDKDAKFYWTEETQTYTINGNDGYLSGWKNIQEQAAEFLAYDKTGAYTLSNGKTAATLSEQETKIKGLFEAYASSFKYTGKVNVDVYEAAKEEVKPADGKVVNVEINFVDAVEGAKYATISADNKKLTAVATAPNDVTGGQVIVPMYIKITDAWGMIMKHEFNVTIKTVQE